MKNNAAPSAIMFLLISLVGLSMPAYSGSFASAVRIESIGPRFRSWECTIRGDYLQCSYRFSDFSQHYSEGGSASDTAPYAGQYITRLQFQDWWRVCAYLHGGLGGGPPNTYCWKRAKLSIAHPPRWDHLDYQGVFSDADNDAFIDSNDNCPGFITDFDGNADIDDDGYGSACDDDDDGDGYPDVSDNCPLDHSSDLTDTDNDGLGNICDEDDDNDGCNDTYNPYPNVIISYDIFPLDPSECFDTDGDGIGNNADWDDDNDGVIDSVDVSPLNSGDNNEINFPLDSFYQGMTLFLE